MNTSSKAAISFREKQGIRAWWIWLILFAVALLPWIGVYVQEVLEQPFGNNPMSTLGLVVLGSALAALLIWMWRITLLTEAHNDHLSLEFGVFGSRNIPWSQIKHAEVVPYVSLGYGYRMSFKYGTVYRAGGKFGVALQLQSGEKLMFSTEQPERWKTILKDLVNPSVGTN